MHFLEGRSLGAIFALSLLAAPGCLLIQPLDDPSDAGASGDSSSASGGGGTGGSGGGGNGGSATAGKGGSDQGGKGGAGGSSGKGGGDSGGSAGSGASAGSGNAAGAGGTTSPPLVYVPVWTFDEDLQDFDPISGSAQSLVNALGFEHDAAEGDPDPGSVMLTLPFTKADQHLEFGRILPIALDLRGKTLAIRIKLDEDFASDPDFPGGAVLYLKTGPMLLSAEGAWTDLVPGEWVTVTLNLDSPAFDGGVDSTDVREIGVSLRTGDNGVGSWQTGVVHLDSLGWTDAVRPACIVDQLLIDDMETPDQIAWLCPTDGRDGGWYVYDDGSVGGTRTPAASVQRFPLDDIDVARGNNHQAVHVTGSGFSEWGGAVGTSLHAGTKTVTSYYDVSRYAGISFWARGQGVMRVQLQLDVSRSSNMDYPGECKPAIGLKCEDHYASPFFGLTSAWTEHVIRFADLKQDGWGKPVPFDYQLHSIEFRFPKVDAFEYWIDDLRFVERDCEDDGATTCSGVGSTCARGSTVDVDCTATCNARGYTAGTCTTGGCSCENQRDPLVPQGIASLCACGAPNLTCTSETIESLEAFSTGPLATVIDCYSDIWSIQNRDDCVTAELACWSQ